MELNFQRLCELIRANLEVGCLKSRLKLVEEQGRPVGELNDLIADWK